MAAIFGVLIVGLAVMGASYAQWTEELTISGTVATGELAAEFSAISCSDNEVDMDVATCEVALEVDGESGTTKIAIITLDNAYPCYMCDVDLTISNTGTIPLHIASVDIVKPDELDVELTGEPVCKIVDAGDTLTFDLHIHVNDQADENSAYSFSATVNIDQFNNA